MRVLGASKLRLVVLSVFLINLLCATYASSHDSKTVFIQKGIYAIVDKDGSESNSTIILTSKGVIVVDTRPTPIEANKVMAEIRKHTELPIIFTINTHFHGDHTFGNQVFDESISIIAHKNVRKALISKFGAQHLELFKTFGIPGMDEVRITPPNLVYEKSMNIDLGGFHLELIHSGKGHTDGDTYIYMNSMRTIITGDLVMNKKIPFMGHAYINEWISSLVKMENLDAEIIIPGHGPVGGKPIVTQMKHYLMKLKDLVIRQIEDGKSLKETQDFVRPILEKKYKGWKKLEWLEDNIERAFFEFS
ncbi:MAG: MBL fold metallo-hydrolase [Nitrospinales bacterium]